MAINVDEQKKAPRDYLSNRHFAFCDRILLDPRRRTLLCQSRSYVRNAIQHSILRLHLVHLPPLLQFDLLLLFPNHVQKSRRTSEVLGKLIRDFTSKHLTKNESIFASCATTSNQNALTTAQRATSVCWSWTTTVLG